jgi:hypothetical protein
MVTLMPIALSQSVNFEEACVHISCNRLHDDTQKKRKKFAFHVNGYMVTKKMNMSRFFFAAMISCRGFFARRGRDHFARGGRGRSRKTLLLFPYSAQHFCHLLLAIVMASHLLLPK